MKKKCFQPRSQKAAPLKVSTQEEISLFFQEVPQVPEYNPERVLGLFKTQTHAGRKLKPTLITTFATNTR